MDTQLRKRMARSHFDALLKIASSRGVPIVALSEDELRKISITDLETICKQVEIILKIPSE